MFQTFDPGKGIGIQLTVLNYIDSSPTRPQLVYNLLVSFSCDLVALLAQLLAVNGIQAKF